MPRKLIITAFVAGFIAIAAVAGVYVSGQYQGESEPLVTVFKTPDCGCCTVWEDYLRDNGFRVESRLQDHSAMNQIKQELGLTAELASCHTGVVDGYVVEGHVPAREIHRMLAERPDAKGISVPRMPIGSPGMEMGDRRDPYNVLLFQAGGESVVYARYHQE